MHDETFRALESGATVITASRRLARVLAGEFHSAQAELGRTTWNRPDVLPLAAFLDRAFREWLDGSSGQDAPVLLSPVQERMLWEQIIRASPAGESLLQIPETAARAVETWRLVVEYRLPLDGRFEAAEDWAAFASWSREFLRRCDSNGWLERSRLADFLREKPRRSPAIILSGFDQLTPQQREFFDALDEWRMSERGGYAPAPERKKLRNSNEEIRAAAIWARRLIERDPETQIGIVVAPDLTRSRAKVDRILGEILEPGLQPKERDRAYHLSIGPTLAEYPAVRAAVLLLEFATGPLPLPRAGMLLRSPFLDAAEAEWGRRSQLDARLRKNGVWDVSSALLRDEAGSCPQLQRVLGRVQKLLRNIPREQAPSDWIRDVERLLDAFGWPGDRTPTSREFQTIAAWRELLSEIAKLDLTAPRMNLAELVGRLQRQVAETRFQIEDEGAPVQVMGMLEASGLRFDHLWILGLHDEALPAPASPNPFLPVSLQRQHGLPHASAERELEFAKGLLNNLIASAPDVVLSYPEAEGDRVLLPSPLISAGWGGGAWLADEAAHDADWIGRMRAAATFEQIEDENAPVLALSDSRGGASLFKDMAACPFRAFARHRLGARPLEEPELGLSYRDRGTTLHKALEFVWRQLRSHAALLETSVAELQALIAAGSEEAIAKLGPGIGRAIEKARLQRLLVQWLEIERARPEFSIAGLETEREADIGGLLVHVRADRVDLLPDGSEIIFDYKTGSQLRAGAWEGDRPDEPQLPLYCATNNHPIAGAAFSVIRVDELRFRGLTASGVSLPAFSKMSADSISFGEQVAVWRRVLECLAQDFRSGNARVDPKSGACDNCGLRALCRVRENEELQS